MKILAKERKEMREIFQRENDRLARQAEENAKQNQVQSRLFINIKTWSQIGQAISSHTFLRAVAIFFHVCNNFMSVVTYYINAISYLDSQK